MKLRRTGFLLAFLPAVLQAHVISMSTGYATVTGNRVEYILRMPEYEIAQIRDPARALFDRIRFTSGFETGRRTGEECHPDPAAGSLICAANYEFSAPVERLGVECSFYEVTVPNHIHMLHAERGGKLDQAILDSSFPSATLSFRPPTAFETAIGQTGSGAFRVWKSSVLLLLLAALAVASRSRPELAAIVIAFIAGACLGTWGILRFAWQPSPRFAEAAAALALAYLGLEILAFPRSSGRWLLALVFGTFAGMFFANFVGDSGYSAIYVLAGASFACILVALAIYVAISLALRSRLPPRFRVAAPQAAAVILLVAGTAWFLMRLRA